MNKIILRVNAGLGNQQFQYAVAKAASLDKGAKLVLDNSYYLPRFHPIKYQGGFLYPYKLRNYNITEGHTGKIQKNLIGIINVRSKIRRAYNMLARLIGPLFELPIVCFDDLSSVMGRSNVIMAGYYQRYSNFEKYRAVILESLSLRIIHSDEIKRVAHEIKSEETVSIHVRRADYISKDNVANNFASVGPGYYQAALKDLEAQRRLDRVLVFSDDIEWVRNNLKLRQNVIWIDFDAEDFEHQWLMSQCKHNIIANSTFSWWAGWLNTNPEKKVYAPELWYRSESRKDDIYIPNAWRRIRNSGASQSANLQSF